VRRNDDIVEVGLVQQRLEEPVRVGQIPLPYQLPARPPAGEPTPRGTELLRAQRRRRKGLRGGTLRVPLAEGPQRTTGQVVSVSRGADAADKARCMAAAAPAPAPVRHKAVAPVHCEHLLPAALDQEQRRRADLRAPAHTALAAALPCRINQPHCTPLKHLQQGLLQYELLQCRHASLQHTRREAPAGRCGARCRAGAPGASHPWR